VIFPFTTQVCDKHDWSNFRRLWSDCCFHDLSEFTGMFWQSVLPQNGKSTMKKSADKTDLFPGILHGDGRGVVVECKCTVALVTRLTPGTSANAVTTSLRIEAAEQSPPDGNYRLNVRGRIFKIRREGGQWPVLKL
jgi:hypothetical protein